MSRVFRLRVEEAIALAFILPTTYLTLIANAYSRKFGWLSDRLTGGMVRLAFALALLSALALARRWWPRAPLVLGLREVVPFLACILIYTNLHDTIGFVNPGDIHPWLAALDQQIFGVVPCVWAQQFITPRLTEVMSFFYMSFFWIAPSTSLLLLTRRRLQEFRATTMAVTICFYIGYALYLVFPAAPPRLVLTYEFKQSLSGVPTLFSNLSARAFELLPVDSRAAFPSLHSAVALMALVYAWRFVRAWFWILLPFVLGLWVSTIYLRHHFFVDLLAGWALVPLASWIAPRLDGWWTRQQRRNGYPTARGAMG